VLRSALSVCSTVDSLTTFTVSDMVPTSSFISTRTRVFAVTRRPVCFSSRKPVSEAVSSYVPGSRLWSVKLPSLSVGDETMCWVPVLVAVTVAPGTAAPCASVTVPVIDPYRVWAPAGRAKSAMAQHSRAATAALIGKGVG
jgi:hypothetical protein